MAVKELLDMDGARVLMERASGQDGTAEAFEFELEDGTTVTKTIPVISTTTGAAS